MMYRRGISLLLGLLVILPALLAAQEATVRAKVDSTEYSVGDPITVHLEAVHPKGTTLTLAAPDSLESFTVIGRVPFSQLTETTSGATIVVAKYDSGSAALPPLEVLYKVPGDTTVRHATTNSLVLTVRTLSVDTSQAFRDLKPTIGMPLTFAEIATYLAILVLIGVIIYVGYRYWKKRSQRVTGEVYVPPARPAHVVALEELAALKEKKLWQQGQIKQYYSEVSEITRRFIENRFSLMALEQTTDEIMAGLKRIRIKASIGGKVEALLQLSDLVKFAKYQPGITEHEAILTIAYDIVEAARPLEQAPAQPGKTEEMVRVES